MVTFLFSTLLLRMAFWWAQLFKTTRLWQARPPAETLLPQQDTDPNRKGRIAAERALYACQPLAANIKIPSNLTLKTVHTVPARERYPIGILIPKLLILTALKLKTRFNRTINSIEEINNLYRILGAPQIRPVWNEDSEFARQRLQGINPVWIKRCDDPALLQSDGLDPEVYQQLLRALHPDCPLYAVNYHRLLEDIPVLPGCYLAPAMAFFELRLGKLEPVGIQLYRHGQGAVWFQPDGSPGWTLAKMFFNSADLFVHESLSHLLWTHLLIENFWLATVRALSQKHPVHKFLAPHFHFMLQANANSNKILLDPDGIFAKLFSAGLEGTVRLFEKGEQMWTLEQSALPALLAKNGTANLPGYLYAEDAMAVWEVIARYARDYVSLYYPLETDFREDTELVAWSTELTDLFGPGKIPALDDPSSLQTVLTAILFNVVQHTYVGALQYDYIAYPPAMPASMHIPVPPSQESVETPDLLRALPGLDQICTTIKATYAFSLQYSTLGMHLEAGHHSPEALRVVGAFQAGLREVENRIARKEQGRQKPYRISGPGRIANSVSA